MIIIDERNVIKGAFEKQGLDVFDFFEGHKVLDLNTFCTFPLQRRSDLLLVDGQSLKNHPELFEKFRALLNTFAGVLFFHDKTDDSARELIALEANFLVKVIGVCSLPMNSLEWTILSNQLQFFWTLREEQKHLQKHMAKFSSELEQLMQTTEKEVAKAKKIHDVLVPRRNEEIKGVHFSSKYVTGDGGGGEFFDLHHVGNKVYQILLSSQSYLISSSLLGVLNLHKQKSFNPIDFLNAAEEEISKINQSKRKKAMTDLLVLELDLSQLILKTYGKGKAEFSSQVRGQLIPQNSGLTLNRGEKIVVFSAGFIFNWNERQDKTDLHTFIKSHQHLSFSDLQTELFYQLRKDVGVLLKDATVMMMEVKRHGMHQI